MNAQWSPLHRELDLWRASGLQIPIWWRDDDAVSDTTALRRLGQLAATAGIDVTLGIIPLHADRSLASYLSYTPHLRPAVHGWSHQNHAPVDEKTAEFGAHRALHDMLDEIENAMGRLHASYGSRLLPMFIPPWNRISGDVLKSLPKLGFRFVSTATPRATKWAAAGLEQVNTHIDPIDWRGTRGLLPIEQIVKNTTDILRDRREGRSDASEPLGLLTHHLVHDEAIWSFCAEFLNVLRSGPVTFWAGPSGDNDESS